MQYGYFDRLLQQYVITDPLTPTPWINYLGGGGYGGIVSHTGGGFSFDGDPRYKRVLRYRYNSVPEDQPGRYIYIRDNGNGKFWSSTWQPVKSDFTRYRCRHGLGQTTIELEEEKIRSEVTYFVPGRESMEIWWLRVQNTDTTPRHLTLFSYAEFCFFDAVKDQQNVDWCQQIQQGEFKDNTIFWNAFMKTWDYIFMTSNLPVTSFETSRDQFIGRYRDLANPIAVQRGYCSNTEALRGNGVGVLTHQLLLEPGEEKEIIYILGTTPDKASLKSRIKHYFEPGQVQQELAYLQQYWRDYLATCSVETPDQEMNLMINTWNPYQCKTTFNWSRFVSLYQLGIDRGMGFRDSAQDILGVLHAIPEESKELLIKLAHCQHADGHAYHLFYPLTGQGTTGEAGHDGGVDWYSDDHLWLIVAITAYLKETGDFTFLQAVVPYAEAGGQGSILQHLLRALEFTATHLGQHGIPLAGFADWNDTINLDRGKGTAESVWTGMFYAYCLREMIDLLIELEEREEASPLPQNDSALYRDSRKKCEDWFGSVKTAINSSGWDGSWYLRAFDDDGRPLGSHTCTEGQIFLNPQSWSIMAGLAGERAPEILANVERYLNTEFGVVLLYPAYKQYDKTKGGVTTYPPGAKENGGIFLHTNPWLIIAETMVGNGDSAMRYYRQVLPTTRNEIAERYEVEPYVYCQNILGKEHPQFGLGRNSWLTGTASWMYRAAVYYILGIRPTYRGMLIDPVVPSSWDSFKVRRRFRSKWLDITCIRGAESEVLVNGASLGGRKEIRLEDLTAETNTITVYFS